MTESVPGISFGPYRLDPVRARLWKRNEPVAIQPRPLAVLCHLAARPGELVARDELIKTLWADTYVTKAVLKVAVRAIREALDDDAEAPQYIETVGREGYRFIGAHANGGRRARGAAEGAADAIVGRESDLAALRAAFEQALAGARRVVFVTGEAGIGKTTLIDRFVDEVAATRRAWLGRGQCLEQYGDGEPYLPVLEAIGRLVRDDGGDELADVLRRHAPTWVSQLPALETHAARRGRTRAGATTMPARMLREMADALEVFTRRRALVLVLEDLQWSDRSTVDLIAGIARRRQPARLLVIGSFRAADAIVHDHPVRTVKQELQANCRCEEIALELLALADVSAYVEARFGAGAEMRQLASRVHDRTDGNALFMINVVNDLVAQRLLVRRDGRWQVEGSIAQATDRIPLGLQELIGRRLARLAPATRRMLEVASVAGEEFAVAAVAAALGEDVAAVEDACETLAAQATFIGDAGVAEWPDGTVTGRYRFLHALYRRVLYDGIAESRRGQLHRAIGLRQEAACGAAATDSAAELAMHFERGRDHARALAYHELAGSAALERHAAHEAAGHFAAALDALAYERDVAGRAERELALVVANATLLMPTKGYAAPETERAFARARALCDASPDSPKVWPVLRGLVSYHHVRAELGEARELGALLLRRAATQRDDRALRVQAHYGQGATLFHMGELDGAREHLEQALREYDPAAHREHLHVYGGYDPGVACSLWLAWTLALLGRLDDAAARDADGLERARGLGDPFSLAWAHQSAGVTQQLFGDWAASERCSAEAARLAEEHGFPHVLGMATVNHGWARVMQGDAAGGIPMLRDGVAAVDATGARLVRPMYLGMLAAADLMEGDLAAAGRRFDDALAEIARTGERLHEPALLIGKSLLLAVVGPRGKSRHEGADAPEACLRRALDVAHAQGARLFELRAAVALARHWQQHGRGAAGRALVDRVHACFADVAPAAPEIVAAREVLAELG